MADGNADDLDIELAAAQRPGDARPRARRCTTARKSAPTGGDSVMDDLAIEFAAVMLPSGPLFELLAEAERPASGFSGGAGAVPVNDPYECFWRHRTAPSLRARLEGAASPAALTGSI